MKKRITMKMIAEQAGVHYSTVSLALNDHPSIPSGTRERLKALAREMDYRPDPMLSALVAYRTNKRRQLDQGVLGWVDTWSGTTNTHERFPALWSGTLKRAKALGWKLEPFYTARPGMSAYKVSQILLSRGIHGVLVAPGLRADEQPALEWPLFSAISLAHTLASPKLHSVLTHQMYNMDLLLRELSLLGYRRPGLALDIAGHKRTLRFERAAFLDSQIDLPQSQQVPPLMEASLSSGTLIEWRNHHRPDVIISSLPNLVIAALNEAGLRVPGDIGVATPAITEASRESKQVENNSGLSRTALKIAGIDEQFEAIGAVAIDNVIAMLNRNESGPPVVPKHVMIGGRWQSGETLTPQAPSKV